MHNCHWVDLTGAVNSCVGLEVCFYAGTGSVPDDGVGGS